MAERQPGARVEQGGRQANDSGGATDQVTRLTAKELKIVALIVQGCFTCMIILFASGFDQIASLFVTAGVTRMSEVPVLVITTLGSVAGSVPPASPARTFAKRNWSARISRTPTYRASISRGWSSPD